MADYKDYQDWYKDYLLDQLNICKAELGFNDFIIRVAKERSFELPKEPNELLFVIKNISGAYVLGIKTQPVQIIGYTEFSTMDIAYQILDLFVKLHHQNQFNENNNLIKEDYDTPVSLKPFVESSDGFKMSLYAMGSYVICENVADIKNLQWYNSETMQKEKVNFITGSLGYSAVLNTTKVSGEEISTSEKQEAGLTLTLVLMNTGDNFCKLINKIMHGTKTGNYKFIFSYELNGVQYTNEIYKLSQASLPFDKKNAPGLNLAFTR